MDNAQLYLLKRIAGYKTNGHDSLGHLNACHVNDVAKVMTDFAKDVLTEVIEGINKGETINVDGMIISANHIKKKKRK